MDFLLRVDPCAKEAFVGIYVTDPHQELLAHQGGLDHPAAPTEDLDEIVRIDLQGICHKWDGGRER